MGKNAIITDSYLIHDVALRFTTNNRFIRSSINGLLGYFSAGKRVFEPDISVSLFDDEKSLHAPFTGSHGSKLLYASSEEDMFNIREFGLEKMELYVNGGGSTHFVDFGDTGLMSYSLEEGTAEGYLQSPETINPNVLSSFIFMFLLNELLRARGYYPVHCSAVEKDGKGIIFPGFSGAGKTTTCIALMRRGFGFLGDDRPILRYGKSGGLELLSFPEHLDVTDETIGLFSELRDNNLFVHNRNLRKKSFYAEDVYPGSIRDCCVPKVILYPEISAAQNSFLENFPKSEALKLFLPHSLLVFDKNIAKKHFDIIVDLIRITDCYRLKLGSEIDDLDELIEAIL